MQPLKYLFEIRPMDEIGGLEATINIGRKKKPRRIVKYLLLNLDDRKTWGCSRRRGFRCLC